MGDNKNIKPLNKNKFINQLLKDKNKIRFNKVEVKIKMTPWGIRFFKKHWLKLKLKMRYFINKIIIKFLK